MTKTSTITPDRVRQLLDYDPATGAFTWRERQLSHFPNSRAMKTWNTRYAGKLAGTIRQDGYVKITIDYVQMYAHQIVWLIEMGEYVEMLDHKNADKSDNRIGNLRPADTAQNGWNTGKQKRNTTGYKGVSICGRTGKFVARALVRGKMHNIGRYLTAEQAHDAYCKAVKELHGAFARTA